MATARKNIVDLNNPGDYHCISRCVRQLFLCGQGMRDRKSWLHERLIELERAFMIDVAAMAFLDNHFHLLLRTQPDRALELSPEEVVWRWFAVYPKSIHRWAASRAAAHPDLKGLRNASGAMTDVAAVEAVARDAHQVELLRKRLSNLSWLMKVLKQEIAVTANREDGVTGHFWEGRYKSIRILDDNARLQVMIYIDLQLVRAGEAETVEASSHTSAQDRILIKQWYDTSTRLTNRWASRNAERERLRRSSAPPPIARLMRAGDAPDADRSCWLSPIGSILKMKLDQYLKLTDDLARMLRPGKRGATPLALPPILQRVGLTTADLERVARGDALAAGSVAGSAKSCAAEALRRGVRYVRDVLRARRAPA